jgi:hypothetical protein
VTAKYFMKFSTAVCRLDDNPLNYSRKCHALLPVGHRRPVGNARGVFSRDYLSEPLTLLEVGSVLPGRIACTRYVAKKGRDYEPRNHQGPSDDPADHERVHKEILGFECIEAVSDEMRALIEELWPELVHKLRRGSRRWDQWAKVGGADDGLFGS